MNGMREINQKQVWTHKDFAKRLEKIKAQRLLVGKPVHSIGELTKEMLQCPSFKKLEKELIESERKATKLPIKFDGVIPS